MGEVYKARHIELGTMHAIKIILPELVSNTKVVDLFRREAAVLRNVRDDAVVGYDGVFRDEFGRVYLVMEFVDGPSLSHVIKQRALSPPEIRMLRDRLALGLAAAHDKGVIHRDMSPDNVILAGSRLENAKIIDFGIAKLEDPSHATILGEDFAGKYSFASPEQLGMFGGEVGPRSDMYSTGLVLAAASMGRPIDMGKSTIAVVDKRRAVPDLTQVPTELRGELALMLQPDPNQRPASMRDLLAQLTAHRGTAAPAPRPVPSEDAQARRRGARGLWLGASAAVAAVAIVGAVAVFSGAFTGDSGGDDVTEEGGGTGGTDVTGGTDITDGGADTLGGGTDVVDGGGDTAGGSDPDDGDTDVAAGGPDVVDGGTDVADGGATTSDGGKDDGGAEDADGGGTTADGDADAVATAAADIAGRYRCASLSTAVTNDLTVMVNGHVRNARDLDRLVAELGGLSGVGGVSHQVSILGYPYCELASFLPALATDAASSPTGPQIRTSRDDATYLAGDSLVLEVTAPADFTGYLYVDYFDHRGNVVHLMPSSWYPDNAVTAGQTVTIGTEADAAAEGDPVYPISEPFGTNLILAIATSEPLFSGLRATAEPASSYIPSLRRALADIAEVAGPTAWDPEAPPVAHVFIETMPR